MFFSHVIKVLSCVLEALGHKKCDGIRPELLLFFIYKLTYHCEKMREANALGKKKEVEENSS